MPPYRILKAAFSYDTYGGHTDAERWKYRAERTLFLPDGVPPALSLAAADLEGVGEDAVLYVVTGTDVVYRFATKDGQLDQRIEVEGP